MSWCCPKSATLQDYYAADMQSETIPEEYVTQLAMSDLAGLDNISPKLSRARRNCRARPSRSRASCPRTSFRRRRPGAARASSRGPIGCGASVGMMGSDDKKTLSRKTSHRDARRQRSPRGGRRGRQARAEGRRHARTCSARSSPSRPCLPQTGTVDDSRIFAHLHTVQDLTKKGPVINAIEIIGCCQEISAGLGGQDSIACCPTPRLSPSRKSSNRRSEHQSHDVEPVAHVPGDYRLRGRGEHRQLHVCERVRAAAGNRHADGAGGRLAAGPESVSAESPAAWASPAESAATCWARSSPSCSARSWPACGCGRCGCWRLRPLSFLSALRLSRVTSPPGVPPGSILVPHSRRFDPC